MDLTYGERNDRIISLLCGAPVGLFGLLMALLVQPVERTALIGTLQDARASTAPVRSDLALQRAVQLGVRGARYDMAVRLAETGQEARAWAMMRALALGETGDPRADWWLARRGLERKRSSPDQLRQLMEHLARAAKADPPIIEAQLALARMLRRSKKYEEAIEVLVGAARVDRRHRIRVLMIAREQQVVLERAGRKAQAQLASSRVRRVAEDLWRNGNHELSSDPKLLWLRRQLATVGVLLGKHPQAARLLQRGLRLTAEDDPAMRRQLSEVLLGWARRSKVGGDPDAIDLLRQALEANVDNVLAVNELLALVDRGGPQVKARAEKVLAGLQQHGLSRARRLQCEGWYAWRAGRRADARKALEAGQALVPDEPTLANDLAWMLGASDEPTDLQRALKLANQAVRRNPRLPVFRDTRGHILARLGRYTEAVTDLRAALTALRPRDRIKAHGALARCYRALKLPELANRHQAAAEALMADLPVPPPR